MALPCFLQLSEAKAALSQQVQMLQELNEWEEVNTSRELLQNCAAPLSGCRVSVCRVQQPHSWISGVITSHDLQTKVSTLTTSPIALWQGLCVACNSLTVLVL